MRFRLVRTNLRDVRLWAQKLEDEILYIRPGRFENGLADTMWVQLAPHANIQGLVLDLRHNPGGLLTEGVSFLNGFVSGGSLGAVHPRKGYPKETFEATSAKVIPDGPIVVLVDGGHSVGFGVCSHCLQKRRNAVCGGRPLWGKEGYSVSSSARWWPLAAFQSLNSPDRLEKRLTQSIAVDEFLAPAAGGTAISGLNPDKDSWVRHAMGLLVKAKRSSAKH